MAEEEVWRKPEEKWRMHEEAKSKREIMQLMWHQDLSDRLRSANQHTQIEHTTFGWPVLEDSSESFPFSQLFLAEWAMSVQLMGH